MFGIDIGDLIMEGFNYILYNFIYRLFYYLEIVICMAMDWIQELMDVFTGASMVTYKTNFGSTQNYLINIFFSNGAISGVYWGMAAIGVVLAFVFAIISVIRKAFDMDEKVKMSIGQILTNLLKSILLIIGLNAGMTVIITATNVLMQSVVYVFDHATEIANGEDHKDFTDEEFAAMARIFNTIGNYSLNPSYKNRYNINSCYNELRGDLAYLASQGVFDYYYETKDEEGNIVQTWQSVLQQLANAADYSVEAPVDVYNEGIANALYDCMQLLKTDTSIRPLSSYDRIEVYDGDQVKLGRTLFLMGTMGNGLTAAAKNDVYNEHPSMTDAVRAPYYRGTKNVYSINDVNKDFDIALHKTNYILIYVAGGAIALSMALVIVTAIARIFNLLFLYVIAPPLFAVMPLDDGAKVKQWMTAFTVQCFSVFGSVISMRIYIIFLPIILDPGLELSNSVIIDLIGRVVMIYAGIEAITKANGILTGILADSAGWQSINAGDMSNYLRGSFGGRAMKTLGGGMDAVGNAALGVAAGVGKGVAAGAWRMTKAGAKLPFKALGKMFGGGGGGAAGGAAGGGDSSKSDGASKKGNEPPKNQAGAQGGQSSGNKLTAGHGGNASGKAQVPPPMRNMNEKK